MREKLGEIKESPEEKPSLLEESSLPGRWRKRSRMEIILDGLGRFSPHLQEVFSRIEERPISVKRGSLELKIFFAFSRGYDSDDFWGPFTQSLNSPSFSSSEDQRRLLEDETIAAMMRASPSLFADEPPIRGRMVRQSIKKAADFLLERTAELGAESLPPVVVDGIYQAQKSDGKVIDVARASSSLRGVVLAVDQVSPVSLHGLFVHEFTHALAHARLRISPAGEREPLASGWIMWRSSDNGLLFQTFEELVATFNQFDAWRSMGAEILSRAKPVLHRYAEHPFSAKFSQIASEFQDQDFFVEASAEDEFGTPETKGGEPKNFFLLHKEYYGSHEDEVLESGYALCIDAFETLAHEMYPTRSREEAFQTFSEKLKRAQFFGSYAELLRDCKAVFGPQGVRFLAALEANPTNDQSCLSFSFLKLFAEASRFPESKRRRVRETLADLLFEVRGFRDWNEKQFKDSEHKTDQR